MKKLFKVTTKTIVATGLGAALFTLLFMFVKVPSPIPETSFQTMVFRPCLQHCLAPFADS